MCTKIKLLLKWQWKDFSVSKINQDVPEKHIPCSSTVFLAIPSHLPVYLSIPLHSSCLLWLNCGDMNAVIGHFYVNLTIKSFAKKGYKNAFVE